MTQWEGQAGEDGVLIGELARRTGVSERLLRYYERRGLIAAERLANGYRDYGESAEQAVVQVRALLAAGLPTRTIRQILPCAVERSRLRPCPGVLDALREHLATLDRRADELARAREILTHTIDSTAAQSDPAPQAPRTAHA
ncbi:MerR family transcriptional regulator [Nonomuraea sp. B12E4]|uniref:MerR family transcriptional regulator n=1 Tax=Nonomuraea sp. B12E4 TaxID=3153564 RepID=UPI00325D803F